MPLLPIRPATNEDANDTETEVMQVDTDSEPSKRSEVPDAIRIKNRRKMYLDRHPSYFGPSLELSDPLLYDRLVRRFQSAAEREAEGRAKGYSGVLEADLQRSEAKLAALARHSQPAAAGSSSYDDDNDADAHADVTTRDQAHARWREVMSLRFVAGADPDFDYGTVDADDALDDWALEERESQDEWFALQPPEWELEDGRQIEGQTGVQDF